MSGKIAGFDFGLKDFLTLHDGEQTKRIESPLFFKQHLNKIRKLNKALSRKKYGSKARKRAKYALAREYKRITDKRRDYFFKLANQLTDKYDVLCFEDLNIKAMKKLWGRKISDLAFSEFLTILQYVAKCKGCVVHFVDRFYPSSKTCHGCKHKLDKLELSVRRWRCPNCGNVNDRDENASMNIRSQGIANLGLADVRPNLIWLSVFEAH
jgi:putative transposase